jgi:pyruvate, orthophosphate dikinase
MEEQDDLDELELLLSRVEEIHEGNPMLGTRGVRLGILYPEIYEMQVHAIMRAAKAVDEGPHPEIMIPLVAYEHELEIMRELVDDRAPPRLLHRQPDRAPGRLLLVRDQRPHPDRAGILAR